MSPYVQSQNSGAAQGRRDEMPDRVGRGYGAARPASIQARQSRVSSAEMPWPTG
jgi:hypothetical protein